MLNISQVILMRTDSNLCRKELTVHWSAPDSLIRSYHQPCTNSMWGDESEAVAPIIWLYQIMDAQKENVFFPDLLITLRSYEVMAWCRQTTSHYLHTCWPRSLPPYGVTRPQWVNMFYLSFFCISFFNKYFNFNDRYLWMTFCHANQILSTLS